jgi:Short-chain dehydrogenases of various substrate specificities
MTQTALVTGAGSGIGRATARTLQTAGWTVYATSPDETGLTDLAETGCQTATLDPTSDADAGRVLDRIGAEEGAVDCLVNAGGITQYGPLEDVSTDRLAAQFEANASGPHRLIREALPNMRRAKSGTIVNVSSVYGRLAAPGVGPYAASMAALEALSDAWRAELDGLGIDVVVVVPGPTRPGAEDRATELDELKRTREYEWVYETLEDAALVTDALPVTDEPEAVATVIHDAACAADPDPRYVVGPVAKALLYAQMLPGRLRDAAFRVLRTVT